MLRVLTDNTTHHLPLAIAPNDEAAVLAYLLNRGANFHDGEGESL